MGQAQEAPEISQLEMLAHAVALPRMALTFHQAQRVTQQADQRGPDQTS